MSSDLNSDIDLNPVKLIGQITRKFSRVVDLPIKELGFAMSQLPVLVALKQNVIASQAELAKVAQVEQSSMAQLLNRMERDGLVQRVSDPNDGRSKLISLTNHASQQMPQAKAIMNAACLQALAGFDSEEQALLYALLMRISANLDIAIREQTHQ